MSGKAQHNYLWLFERLTEALSRAESDGAYNRQYKFYAQNSIHVQWPRQFLDELVIKYSSLTGLKINALQLRTKIANTRVKAFITMAESSKAPWMSLMCFVNNYEPRKLKKYRPRVELEDEAQNGLRKRAALPRVQHHYPTSAIKAHSSENQPMRSAHNFVAPSSSPAPVSRLVSSGTILNSTGRIENAEVDLETKLNALDQLSGASNVCTVHDSLMNGELKMAFLLSQHLKIPALARV